MSSKVQNIYFTTTLQEEEDTMEEDDEREEKETEGEKENGKKKITGMFPSHGQITVNYCYFVAGLYETINEIYC
jgi:hypothetical protein